MNVKYSSENTITALISLIKLKFATKEHTHDIASDTQNGFMSSSDKSKIDQIRNLNSGNSLPDTGQEGDIFLLRQS